MNRIEATTDRPKQAEPKRQEVTNSEPKKQNDDAVRVTRSAPVASNADEKSAHSEGGNESESPSSNGEAQQERENLDRTV